MRIERVQKPAGLAYPLNLVKAHLRTNGYDDENGLTTSYIHAAVEDIARWTWVHLQSADYVAKLDGWETDLKIKRKPVTEITAIKYYDANGDLQTMAENTDYYVSLHGNYARIQFKNQPTLRDQPFDNIEITFKAGYLTHFEIPDDLIDALFMLVADKFDTRQSLTSGMSSTYNQIPMSVQSILNNNSIRDFG